MNTIQSNAELEEFYEARDPWGYEDSPDDHQRREILLSEIPVRPYRRVLDIGCGHGFVTKSLPGDFVLGVDIAAGAIAQAKQDMPDRFQFQKCSLFDLASVEIEPFDLIVITGVLYPQYIGSSGPFITRLLDQLLVADGILVSVHIDAWATLRFPYFLLNQHTYPYREYLHRLEVYAK